MTSCTASWRETNPNVGDEINADFTWADAVWHWTGEFYCDMAIFDPTGERRAYYVEIDDNAGAHTLTINFADIPGEWTCTIRVWDGSAFVVCTDYVIVAASGTICTAHWREANPEVDDTINADFTWSNAREHGSGIYCSMGIYDPDGILVDSYDETTNETGSYTLSVTADVAGDWTCLIAAWTGFAWLYASDVVYVSPGGGDGPWMVFRHDLSTWYTGSYEPGQQNVNLAEAWFENAGDVTSGTIYIRLYAYPGETNEELLASTQSWGYAPGEIDGVLLKGNIPVNATDPLPVGIKIWDESNPEPLWGSMGTKIFKT